MTAIEVQDLLGKAVFKLWPSLPKQIQDQLFETAAPPGGDARMAMATIMRRSPEASPAKLPTAS